MISTRKKMLRLGAALLAMGLAGGAAGAQQIRTVYSPSQLHEDPNAALSRYVRSLADSPRSVSALVGAGQASLDLGDPKTALTFFARAEEVAPRDGRVKAGMGSAFVLMEQPEAALRFFAEAESFGIPAERFAADRGLAYDLTGDPRRAQADYRLALRKGDDPEVRQRLALSLAISGDREGALKTIDDLIRKQDRGAWRTRAFILALTGDTKGATAATEAVMPAQAEAMKPFYAQLPWLTPAERANAVHFGRFPAGEAGTRTAAGAAGTQYASTGAATPETSRSRSARTPSRNAEPSNSRTESRQSRRRPGAQTEAEKVGPGARASADNRTVRPVAAQPRETQPAPVRSTPKPRSEEKAEPSDPGPAPESTAKPAFSTRFAETKPAPAAGPPAASTPQPHAAEAKPAPTRTSPAASERVMKAAADRSRPEPVRTAAAAPKEAAPKPVYIPFGPPTPGTPPRLADISESVASLPAVVKDEDEAPAEKPDAPSRHWVQIAGGANKDSLPREFDRLKERAPDLLSGRTAWTTPLRFTNRLLVGPFDSEGDAQEFVNKLAEEELSAFSWTSEEGQEIEKLSSK